MSKENSIDHLSYFNLFDDLDVTFLF